jgi:hypothetical protein
VTAQTPAEPTPASPAPRPEPQATGSPTSEPPGTETSATGTRVPEAPANESSATEPEVQEPPVAEPPTSRPSAIEPRIPEPSASKPAPRTLRAVLRWACALLVFGSLGSATAYGLTTLDRTDLPGLSTRHDGRWDFPRLTKPALPSGVPRPFDEANEAEAHHADLRDLLLPAPLGAKPDKSLEGRDGWLPTERYLKEYEADSREDIRQQLVDDACRHIAARGWTMPDGTHARVYLLQFNSGALANRFHQQALSGALIAGTPLAEGPDSELDENWEGSDGNAVGDAVFYVYNEAKPRGDRHARHAYIIAGDVVAVVVHSRPGTAAKVPFFQTVALQSQLLS